MHKPLPIERMLVFHYPEVKNSPNLPINYQYAMHFTGSNVNERGEATEAEESAYSIAIPALQCNMSEFYTFYKPISRVFDGKSAI
jgi:hypothetical protein